MYACCMSMKRKAAQAARRQVRVVVGDYEKTLYAKLERMRVAFKPKPRFMPHAVWSWCVKQVIDLDVLQKNDIKNVETGTQGTQAVEQPQDGGARA